MHVMNGIVRRRSWLLAAAVLAALLAVAALSLGPARADTDSPPSDLEALDLPPDLKVVVKLVGNAGSAVPVNKTSEAEAYLTYSGPAVTTAINVIGGAGGSTLRGSTEWLRDDSSSSRLTIDGQSLHGTDDCEHNEAGERGGDPTDTENYGEDLDPEDDINECKISLDTSTTTEEGKFNVYEGDDDFTITATIVIANGARAHTTATHADDALDSDVDAHYPRARTTHRGSLRITVGAGDNQVSAVNMAVAGACGEAAADRGSLGTGSRTAPCQTTIPSQGGHTSLFLSILNKDGGAAAATNVSSVLVSTNRGTLATATANLANCSGLVCQFDTDRLATANLVAIPVTITHNGKVGTASISATVLDKQANAFRTDPVEIIFAGPATSFVIGEAPAALTDRATEDDDTDQLYLTVTATDASGNTAPFARRGARATFKDSAGKTAKGFSTDWADTSGGTEFPRRDGSIAVKINVTATAAEPVPAGVYTLELRNAGLTASQTFTVAGPPHSIEISEPEGTLAVGSRVMVTVTVKDANGNPVADGTPVRWTEASVGGTGNRLVGLTTQGVLKNGEATGSYLILSSGRAYVSVSVGNGALTDIKLLTLGGPPVVASPSDDLSGKTAGYQSYLGTAGTTASALLADLSGINGVLIRQGSVWIRYSIAAGRVIPGSVDFAINRGAVLWLSGE